MLVDRSARDKKNGLPLLDQLLPITTRHGRTCPPQPLVGEFPSRFTTIPRGALAPSAQTLACLSTQDINDHNALIRALALRTMSAIPVAEVHRQLVEPLRHALKDQDPYVRKTAAIAVAKVYMHDRRLIERTDMITRLRDLLMDPNPTVIANAVAALTEISERSDNIHLRFNSDVARRLVRAMSEASECVSRNHPPKPPLPKSG